MTKSELKSNLEGLNGVELLSEEDINKIVEMVKKNLEVKTGRLLNLQESND